MKQQIQIELFEENPTINFYTLRVGDDDLTEVEKFFEKFPEGCEYDKDMNKIISWWDKISCIGAKERFFRPEGRYGDGVGAIPIEVGRIRLYCIRINDHLLIVGNGGEKNVRAWQESPELARYVRTLQTAANVIKRRTRINEIRILNEREMIGNLKFELDYETE